MHNLSSLTDQELVAKTVAGESAAYGCLYDRYVEQIYRFVYFRVSNRQDAEDLTEAVFLKTYESIQNKRRKIDQIKLWFYRTARNLVIDYYRTYKTSLHLDELGEFRADQVSLESHLVEEESQRRLKKAVEMLEPEQQMIIACRFVNRLSHEETSQVLGIKADNLRVLQHRALKKLRKILEECQENE
jgi:RNA polymerase sigma-70 factor, ECF subfamily